MEASNIENTADQQYMSMALELASRGLYTASPNPCVGCVIVRDGIILGQGYHVRAGLPHAEVCAMRDAKSKGHDITNATAYVTLEPCSHYGLTPPCAKALVEAKVSRVVCACTDPNPLVSGRGIKILEDAGIEVKTDILKEQALELNKSFFYAMKHSRPYVTVKCGMSLDAKTALANGESKWITSTESRHDVQRLRCLNSAIMTTANTVLMDNPSMTIRYDELSCEVKDNYPYELLRQPLRIIVDTKEVINAEHMDSLNIFKVQGHVLLVHLSHDNSIHEEVINSNLTILRVPSVQDKAQQDVVLDEKKRLGGCSMHISFEHLYAYLHAQKIRSVLVEAGGNFVASLIENGAVNELVTYVAPMILGNEARSGLPLKAIANLKDALHLHLLESKVIGQDIRLTYGF